VVLACHCGELKENVASDGQSGISRSRFQGEDMATCPPDDCSRLLIETFMQSAQKEIEVVKATVVTLGVTPQIIGNKSGSLCTFKLHGNDRLDQLALPAPVDTLGNR
jgi:hypothetical protein